MIEGRRASRPPHLARLLPDLAAGTVSALVTLSYSSSYAALIFSGPTLEPFVPYGMRAALMAAAVVALVVALLSSVPVAIGGPDANATAILAVMATSLGGGLAAFGVSGWPAGAAVLWMLALSVLRWGRAVRLLPYPVAGGFLAGSGFLILAGAFRVLTRQSLSWNGLEHLSVIPALAWLDRKSTRLNSSHVKISYAVFCLKKKKSINTLKVKINRVRLRREIRKNHKKA